MTQSCEHKLIGGKRQTTLCQHRANGANPCRSCPFVSQAVAEGGQKLRNVEHAKPLVRIKGVGDHLHDIIVEKFGVYAKSGCGCDDMIAKMNAWGPSGCIANAETIIAHLMGQSDLLPAALRMALKLPFAGRIARNTARAMLDEAIGRALLSEQHHA